MLAVSSSPTPWIDVSSLPKKSNMAMTESDPDPMVRTIAPTPWIDVSSLPKKSNMAMTESDPDPMVRTIALPTQWLEQCP